jgi:hypothetical protein
MDTQHIFCTGGFADSCSKKKSSMSAINQLSTGPCTEQELEPLREELRASKNSIIAAYVLVVIAAALLPWPGSARTHGKAMVDTMSYPAAFVSIAAVGSFIVWFYFFRTVWKIKKDLRLKVKVISPGCVKKKYDKLTKRTGKYNFKEVPGTYVDIAGPAAFKYIELTHEEFSGINEGDSVEVSFFPNSKKIIRIRKNSSADSMSSDE